MSATATAARAGTISPALLLPHDRIARAPLGAWAARLLERADRCRRECRTLRQVGEELSTVGNNAALAAAHRGDGAMAWRLCELQIRHFDRLARRSGNPELRMLTVQPWVNIGRLEALRGDWQAALARFARLTAPGADGRLCLGTVRVGPGEAALPQRREGFGEFLRTVYVVDSLRALLQARRWAEVEIFARKLASGERTGLAAFAREAMVVAACQQGDLDRAREIAETAGREMRGWFRAVFRLRLAEVHACAGDTDLAVPALAAIAGVVTQLSPERKSDVNTLYVTSRLAQACVDAGLDNDACAVARDVFDGARTADDEGFQIEALRILADASPPDERASWANALDCAQEATEYRRYRPAGSPPGENPIIEELYKRVLDMFSY
jgi:hypothetical protein